MNQKSMHNTILKIVMAGLLTAVGILIPMISPLKIVIPPASFTVASHVAVFIAMFISPAVGIAVALGTTLGFLIGGFPVEIVLRALTHVVFTTVGSLWIKKNPSLLSSWKKEHWPVRDFGSHPRGVRGAGRAPILFRESVQVYKRLLYGGHPARGRRFRCA